MDIRTCPLDPGLTIAEIDAGSEQAWHFLPFEDRRAELIALDERYVLALGSIGSLSHAMAIFDRVERRRTNIETNALLRLRSASGAPPTWCYSPAHGSVFVIEAPHEGITPHAADHLRQLSVDGSVNRRIEVAPGFHTRNLVAREDGRLVCGGFGQVAILDPATGQVEVHSSDLLEIQGHRSHTLLRWFSPDGRWALRPHLGSVIRSGTPSSGESKVVSLLSRILSRKDRADEADDVHPDLPGDGLRRFGLALDLYRLDPFAFERRLIVRYFPTDAQHQAAGPLDALADIRDHRTWDGRDQLFLVDWQESAEARLIKGQFERISKVDWDPDSRGFTLAFSAGTRTVRVDWPVWARNMDHRVTDLEVRHVSLDGTVGPLAEVPGPKDFAELPTEAAISAIKALVRERASQRIDCAGWTGTDVAASLAAMRRLIAEHGLENLVFGDQLQFRFRVDGRSVGEKKFFEAVRALPPGEVAPVLPELRGLLADYGRAARALQAARYRIIWSGPSDHSPNALSEAALTLATLDPGGFDALRDWVVTVDQEHDCFAAAKVFPAVARCTGFASLEAVRFGLWFFLQQWQTVKFEKSWLGLFEATPAVLPPAPFAAAVLEEAQDVAGFSKATSVESGLARVRRMLGRTFWDKAAAAELDRLLAALPPE